MPKNRKVNKGVIKIIEIMAVTTIPISKEFHDWLKSKGMKGESYEDVIKKLLKPEYQRELKGSKESFNDSKEVPNEPEEGSKESSDNSKESSDESDSFES